MTGPESTPRTDRAAGANLPPIPGERMARQIEDATESAVDEDADARDLRSPDPQRSRLALPGAGFSAGFGASDRASHGAELPTHAAHPALSSSWPNTRPADPHCPPPARLSKHERSETTSHGR